MPPRRRVNRNNDEDDQLETLVTNAVNTAIAGLLPNLMAQTAQTVLQQIQQAGGAGGNGGGAGGIHIWLERFMKQKPKSFSSATTPVEARNWIAHVEKIFEVLGVDDVFKTRLASYKLEDDALVWWEGVKLANGGDVYATTLPWADFSTIFYQHYFSEVERNQYAREYASIEQRDDEPWPEFMARFCRLASFLGEAAGTPEVQADKMKWAVNEGTRRWIVTQRFNTITEVADAVKTLEMEKQKSLAKSEESRKRNREVNQNHQTQEQKAKFNNSHPNQANPNQNQNQTPICPSCGNRHFGVCRRSMGTCFRCGKTGHLVKDCPYPDNKGKTDGNANRPATTGGRVFVLDAKAAANTPGN